MLVAGMPGSTGAGLGKPISAAQRNAETLFETKNVVEIREVRFFPRSEGVEHVLHPPRPSTRCFSAHVLQ